MDPLSHPAIRFAAAALATAAATGSLAHVARRWGRGKWSTLSALLLGPDDPEQGDLRFASVVASVAAGLSWIVALDAPLKALSPVGRVAAIGVGLPVISLLVASLADLLAQRESPEKSPESAPSEEPTSTTSAGETPPPRLDSDAHARPARSPISQDEVRKLIDEALGEVGAARARTEDASVRDALASMEEALTEYSKVVEDADADLERIALRVREVAALARSCDDDGGDAFRVLGLRRGCSPDEAKRVYRELAKIYHADANVPGVDPDKFKEISLAYERVRETSRETARAATTTTVDPF